MTLAYLDGFYSSEIPVDQPVVWNVTIPSSAPQFVAASVSVGDARALQEASKQTEAEFFAQHGFALLAHASAVQDWSQGSADIANIYLDEVETLIRTRLLPGRRIEVARNPGAYARRGPGTANPFYARGVHLDYRLDAEGYANAIDAFSPAQANHWREAFVRPNVIGFRVIDLWRTTGMRRPLRHMPLALCDPGSIDAADIILTDLLGIAPRGRSSPQLGLRYNASQEWFSYSRMTSQEVLAFSLFDSNKNEVPRLRSCFHCAYADPVAPADAEPRQSCEFRVGVFLLEE
ncbi:MAG TPA: CmcJ/NvfI family oxidoreductase [Caulobacterales bacterium]|jgi:hypothetical protein|nr:CmcJ/NvfI family oxidoreductase [Caulobacterales bacterium]